MRQRDRRGRDRSRKGGPISLVVKLVGAGVGLGVEAYHHRQEKKHLQSPASAGENSEARATSSRRSSDNEISREIDSMDISDHPLSTNDVKRSKSVQDDQIPDEPPPQYVELPQAQAKALIERGEAVLVDEKQRDLSPEDESPLENDEQDWTLDEAADEVDGAPSDQHQAKSDEKKNSARVNVDELIAKFMVKHPEIGRPVVCTSLPVPVILPQRRPGTKKRGFVRAYAPMLDECGINQKMFLDFLQTFDECAKVSRSYCVSICFLPG